MRLARWPNEGFVRIVDVPDGREDNRIVYEGDRTQRWLNENDDLGHGHWYWDWFDDRQRVDILDTDQRAMTLEQPRHGHGYQNGQRYYAFNLVSELDSSGE